MQRVTRSTAAVALPAPPAGAGAPGFFTGGNSGTGAPATIPGYEWFNGVQEELMYVIEQAGLTGSATDHTKLRQAIQLLVAAGTLPTGAMLPFPIGYAPSGWAKANGNLVPRTGGWTALWAFAQASGNLISDAAWLAGRPGSFSTGDGSTTFRLPDWRGLFLRGFHDGSGTYDSDTATPLGGYRNSQNKAHTHTASAVYQNNPVNSLSSGGGAQYEVVTMTTSSEGGVEGYPRHSSALWCIKA